LAAVVIDSPGSTVQDNTFTRSAGTSLGVFSGGVVVAGNSVVDNGGPGATFNRADSVVVRANTFHGNNTRHFIVANCGGYCTMAGLKITHSASVVIEGNTFTGNDGNGFWCDEGCTAATVTGNTASRNTGTGLYWEVSSRVVISGNTVTGNGEGVKVSGSDHVTLTRNTFRDNVIQLGLYDDPRSPSTDAYSAGLGLSWNTTSIVITGNRFAGGARTRLLLETNRTGQVDAGDMVSDAGNNAVTGTVAIVWCPTTCTTYPALLAFTAATGISFATPAG
jgi:poly(beta-D-mannuronate) C5 epimerase